MPIILGVDIGGTDIKLGLVDESGLRESAKIATFPAEGPERAAARVAAWVGANRGAGPVAAAGVDCAGLIDGARGVLHVSPNLAGWVDVPLGGLFERALGVPVIVENDANAAAYGEWRAGAGRGLSNFVCLTLGTGVGGGMIVNGALYRGSTGFAGEIGHTIVLEGGPLCACGHRGCVESLIGASAIIARARAMLASSGERRPAWDDALTVERIARAAQDGDSVAAAALAETGRWLGVALTNVVHVLAPEAIALGGGVAGAGELILAPARETLRGCVMDELMARVRIVPAELGNSAAVIGAAFLALAGTGDVR